VSCIFLSEAHRERRKRTKGEWNLSGDKKKSAAVVLRLPCGGAYSRCGVHVGASHLGDRAHAARVEVMDTLCIRILIRHHPVEAAAAGRLSKHFASTMVGVASVSDSVSTRQNFIDSIRHGRSRELNLYLEQSIRGFCRGKKILELAESSVPPHLDQNCVILLLL
jgi:hypothetical protein